MQWPVSPRDALREPVRIGAHGVVFVHNHHPSSGVMARSRICGSARPNTRCGFRKFRRSGSGNSGRLST
jgi:hypothetical protein